MANVAPSTRSLVLHVIVPVITKNGSGNPPGCYCPACPACPALLPASPPTRLSLRKKNRTLRSSKSTGRIQNAQLAHLLHFQVVRAATDSTTTSSCCSLASFSGLIVLNHVALKKKAHTFKTNGSRCDARGLCVLDKKCLLLFIWGGCF